MIQLSKKAKEISLVLSAPDIDLWKLRELALTEGGLVNGMFGCRQVTYRHYERTVFEACILTL